MKKQSVFVASLLLSTTLLGGFCPRHSVEHHSNCMDCVRCFGLENPYTNSQGVNDTLKDSEVIVIIDDITSKSGVDCISVERVKECNEIAKEVYGISYDIWTEEDRFNHKARREMITLYLCHKAYSEYSVTNRIPSEVALVKSWYETEKMNRPKAK